MYLSCLIYFLCMQHWCELDLYILNSVKVAHEEAGYCLHVLFVCPHLCMYSGPWLQRPLLSDHLSWKNIFLGILFKLFILVTSHVRTPVIMSDHKLVNIIIMMSGLSSQVSLYSQNQHALTLMKLIMAFGTFISLTTNFLQGSLRNLTKYRLYIGMKL